MSSRNVILRRYDDVEVCPESSNFKIRVFIKNFCKRPEDYLRRSIFKSLCIFKCQQHHLRWPENGLSHFGLQPPLNENPENVINSY